MSRWLTKRPPRKPKTGRGENHRCWRICFMMFASSRSSNKSSHILTRNLIFVCLQCQKCMLVRQVFQYQATEQIAWELLWHCSVFHLWNLSMERGKGNAYCPLDRKGRDEIHNAKKHVHWLLCRLASLSLTQAFNKSHPYFGWLLSCSVTIRLWPDSP